MARKKFNIDGLKEKANLLTDEQQLDTKGGYYITRRGGGSFWWERGGGIIDDDIDFRRGSNPGIHSNG